MYELLTPGEAAEMLRIGESKVRELMKDHDLPFVRIGRRVFVTKAGVAWFFAQNYEPTRKKQAIKQEGRPWTFPRSSNISRG